MSTESELARLKEWYWHNWPLCLFCNHKVRKYGDLAHLIRRSASREYLTLKLNTGLAHRECHRIFDNSPRQAIYLPRFYECMYLIWKIDVQYYGSFCFSYNQLGIDLPDFFQIDPHIPPLEHHGELLTLLPLLTLQGLILPSLRGSPDLPASQGDHSSREE